MQPDGQTIDPQIPGPSLSTIPGAFLSRRADATAAAAGATTAAALGDGAADPIPQV